MFPCLGFLVADPSCSYRAPLFSLASALLQRSCEQLQPYVGNGSTPCRLALFSNPRASSRRTSLQLPVARYLALHRHTESSPGRTISRTSPEAIRTMISIAAYHLGTQPAISGRSEPKSDLDCGIPPRYPAISGSSNTFVFGAIRMVLERPKFRSRLRHTT